MKILYIQPYSPISIPYGGEMRSRRIAEYLKKKGEVDIFILQNCNKNTDFDYLKTNFHSFHFGEQKDSSSYLEKLRLFLPWQLAELYSIETQQKLNNLVEKENYDLIFVIKLYPVPYILRLSSKWHEKVVIDFDDVLSDLFRSSYKNFIASRKNSFFLKINEERALKCFKRIFICSENALSKIKESFHKKIGIIPNVFPFDPNCVYPISQETNQLFFVGSLDYSPNVEGLEVFLKSIWPKVKGVFPDLKLTIAGKVPYKPERTCARLSKYPDVKIETNVPDVKPYYRDCYASIVPLLNGSGTRIKILESCALGRPVITTLKGMEGLNFKVNEQILTFKDSDTFIDSYKRLLNPKTYSNIVNSALEILKISYSEDTFNKSMDDNWKIITQR